jgi:hypothetical protein
MERRLEVGKRSVEVVGDGELARVEPENPGRWRSIYRY